MQAIARKQEQRAEQQSEYRQYVSFHAPHLHAAPFKEPKDRIVPCLHSLLIVSRIAAIGL
ncbi:hypothetical protein Rhsp01_10570 [Rhizobium sp. NBRC 114257]|nr:hypothetical protein Rhsp01_10570 [Rhizobium sp. NBRC 114257]